MKGKQLQTFRSEISFKDLLRHSPSQSFTFSVIHLLRHSPSQAFTFKPSPSQSFTFSGIHLQAFPFKDKKELQAKISPHSSQLRLPRRFIYSNKERLSMSLDSPLSFVCFPSWDAKKSPLILCLLAQLRQCSYYNRFCFPNRLLRGGGSITSCLGAGIDWS